MAQAVVRRSQIPILLVAIGVAALLLMMQPAGGPAEATGNPPDFAIAIDVGGGGDDCDTRPGTSAIGTGCTVPVGSMFTVRTHVVTFSPPPAGTTGYIVWRVQLNYTSGGLTRNDRGPAPSPPSIFTGELGSPTYWDKTCNSIQTESDSSGMYVLDCWNSGGTGSSVWELDETDGTPDGKILEVDFTCSSAGQHVITLDDSTIMHNQSHATLFEKDGDESLLINCKELGGGDDTDGDTIDNSVDTNDDDDGCTDVQEQGSSKALGGLRNPHNFWDFFDTPTGMTPARDKAIAGTDFFALLGRFGAMGDDTIDPLSTPPAAPAYHTAYDRGASIGPNSWSLGPADGTIAGTDFFALLGQFGDTCA